MFALGLYIETHMLTVERFVWGLVQIAGKNSVSSSDGTCTFNPAGSQVSITRSIPIMWKILELSNVISIDSNPDIGNKGFQGPRGNSLQI